MSSVSQVANQQVQQAIAGLSSSSVGAELFTVANLFEAEHALRRNLSDSGLSQEARQGLVSELLADKVSADTAKVVKAIVSARWSSDSDLVDAIESAGSLVLLADAEKAGHQSRVEEEIFYFARLIDAEADLQMALSDPSSTPQGKVKLVSTLLSGRTHADTITLVSQYISHPRGRRIGKALDELSALAAARQNRLVATVTSAIALSDSHKSRITAALSRIYGQDVLIDTIIDDSVVGGVSVQIGDDVIDGTISTRIQQALRQLQA
jgi:F-type H+-transporting ATPase subunit delta